MGVFIAHTSAYIEYYVIYISCSLFYFLLQFFNFSTFCICWRMNLWKQLGLELSSDEEKECHGSIQIDEVQATRIKLTFER